MADIDPQIDHGSDRPERQHWANLLATDSRPAPDILTTL
jgi:hypothetical protein